MSDERGYASNVVEWRASDDASSPGVITAHGIVFGRRSEDLGGFVEVVSPDAVNGADMSSTVSAFNHDPNQVIGRLDENMTVKVETGGMRYTVRLPKTAAGRDVAELAQQKIVTGSSFGFRLAPDGDEWTLDTDGRALRTLTNIARIYDLSPVVRPAYRGTADGDSAVSFAHRSLSRWSGVEIDEVRSLAKSGHLAQLVSARDRVVDVVDVAGSRALIQQRRDLLDRAARSHRKG